VRETPQETLLEGWQGFCHCDGLLGGYATLPILARGLRTATSSNGPSSRERAPKISSALLTEVFEGLRFGDANVQLDDTLILIEPEAAKEYQTALPGHLKPTAGFANGGTLSPTGPHDPSTSNSPTADASAAFVTGTARPKLFVTSIGGTESDFAGGTAASAPYI
jgi:hypothetical protein